MHFTFVAFLTVLVTLQAKPSTSTKVEDPVESPLEKNASITFNSATLAAMKITEWGQCANGWHMYRGNCYQWAGKNQKTTWFEAELNCRTAGGHLVSVDTPQESEILRGLTLCENDYWIGLVNTQYAKTLFVKQEGWSWWNLKNHNFTRLKVANTAGLDCAFARPDGSWSNSLCSHLKRSWVCKILPEFETNVQFQASTIQPTHCPKDWVYYNKNCYHFSNYTANYFHAQLSCAKQGADVVVVHSDKEQAFLQAVNGCDKPFWIGLQESKPCLSITALGQCWEWPNLEIIVYTNWAAANPKLNTNECVHSQGYWQNSKTCSTKLNYVCKKKVNL